MTNDGPKISIVIPTYGRADYLKKLVKSISETVPANNYEIIIISSDLPDSEKISWLKNQENVQVILADSRSSNQKRKKSLYYYTNIGIKHSKFHWVFVVNDDMRFDSEWYRFFSEDVKQDVDASIGMIIAATHIGDINLGCRIATIGRVKKNNSAWKDLYLSDISIIRREVLEQIGYFDEGLDWFGSGMDNTLSIELLTDRKILPDERIKITHYITDEHREVGVGRAFYDFNYLKKKWDKWCKNNDCEYECNFGVEEYSLINRLRYFFIRLKVKINRQDKRM